MWRKGPFTKREKARMSSLEGVTILRGNSNGKGRFSLSLRATTESSLHFNEYLCLLEADLLCFGGFKARCTLLENLVCK